MNSDDLLMVLDFHLSILSGMVILYKPFLIYTPLIYFHLIYLPNTYLSNQSYPNGLLFSLPTLNLIPSSLHNYAVHPSSTDSQSY